MFDTFGCGDGKGYKIIKEKEKFFGIYFYDWGNKRFITHRESLRSAQKVAKLLSEAYKMGVDSVYFSIK